MDSALIRQFAELFSGSDLSHGVWTGTRGFTKHEAPSLPVFEDHLLGKTGLGVVPLKPNGHCSFGVLDIDVDTIDHHALWVKVEARNLPLTVCRSKSGAAHLYVFFKPEVPAQLARKLLRSWAGLLGYPTCEVFPKQVVVDDKNKGNWINLPYFGGDSTTRYAMGPDGPMSLQEFIQSVTYYDPSKPINKELPQLGEDQLGDMPPCLEALTRNGLPEGGRNMGLFNFGVFYRKSQPNGWEERVREHNRRFVSPPVDDRELEGIIKSLGRASYHYTCEQEPISSRCDKKTCLQRPYGVGHKPWDEPGSYDELVLRNLRKFNTSPPRYRIEVNGVDMELASEELRSYSIGFKARAFEQLDLVLRPMKQDAWDRQLRQLVRTMTVLEAPEDASVTGVILQKTHEFLAIAAERSRKKEDILRGVAWQDDEGTIWFRSADLQKFLTASKVSYEVQKLYPLLQAEGARYEHVEIKGRRLILWAMPRREGDQQTEPFEAPEENKEEDLL